jgi:cold-inducible RNA-binding protein
MVREQAIATSEAALQRASEHEPSLLPLHRSHFSFEASYKLPSEGQEDISMSVKLYVGNLAFQTSSEDLQQLFAQAGTVESATVVEDRETGRSRGFGFVEMSSKEEGAAAIAQFNGKEVNGRDLNVNEAKPREDRGQRNGGRSDFGGNRGSRY